jgi:simple sugar transport system substrate-binding protein
MPDKRRTPLADSVAGPNSWRAEYGPGEPAQRTPSKSSRRERPVSEGIRQARKWGSAATAGIAVLVAAACSSPGSGQANSPSSSSSAGTSAKVTKIAIALPAKISDYGWNQQGASAARTVATASGAHLTVISNIGYNNTQALLSQLARAHAQFIIAHASGFDTAAKQVAQQYHVPVMTYDIPNELVPGLVSNITTSAQQGGYLAGILAARMTKTKTVGIVISASDTNWYEMSGGFAAGVHSVNPKVKIRFAEIGPAAYDDSAGGKRVAQTLMAAGADVVFGMGDGASFGYLQAISNANVGHKVWYIGDIGNIGPIDTKHVLLSSELWNFTRAYTQAVQDIKNGTYGHHGYNLDLANGGISLLKTAYIPASVWSEIQSAQQKIISGQLKVPVATTLTQVKALVSANG